MAFISALTFASVVAAGEDEVLVQQANIAYQQGDYATARQYWSQSAEQGNADAQVKLAMLYQKGQGVEANYEKAAELYRLAAVQGNGEAQNNLAILYENGQGVPQDSKEAFYWYQLAAIQGNASAQNKLGQIYESGQGVTIDEQRAASLYRSAADNGEALAQANLGRLLKIGKGLEKNVIEAAVWFRKAAEQDIAEAQTALGALYMSGEGVERNYAIAAKWFNKAAERGDVEAQINLGHLYLTGKGVIKNYAKAFELFEKAAEKGNAVAEFNLGAMYGNGRGVPRDDNKAAIWYRKAADKGNAFAQFNLAALYTLGTGVEQNNNEAVRWMTKAAEQGLSRAQFNLGLMYEEGRGVPRSRTAALNWYQLAANQGDAEASQRLENLKNSLIGRLTGIELNLPNLDRVNKIGMWGWIIILTQIIYLANYYFKYRTLRVFERKSREALLNLSRNPPGAILKALFKAKFGFILGLSAVGAFFFFWTEAEYILALIISGLTFAAILPKLLTDVKLALRLIDATRNTSEFASTDYVMLKCGIKVDKKGVKKFAAIFESKKKKLKQQQSEESAHAMLLAVLACMEATNKINVFELANDIYFCPPNYPAQFCQEITFKVEEYRETDGVKIHQIIKAIENHSTLTKDAAFDFLIGYFEFGKIVAKKGSLYFVDNECYNNLSQCDCCGQVIFYETIECITGEIFCSELCREVYGKLLTQDFVPSDEFVAAGRAISRGIDGLTASAAGQLWSDNQKVFATGGQGHGFAAEKANTYIDRIKGKDARVVGGDNAKNGPDRIVNGELIQTKYCKTAARSVGAAFDGQSGNYKYMTSGGRPMPIEVPSDQFEAAQDFMMKAYEQGRIPGVSREEVHKLIVRGEITYKQAINITRYGTVEGLLFDAREASVVAVQGGSISFLLNFARFYWHSNDAKASFESTLVVTAKSSAKQFGTTVLVQQLHRIAAIQKFSTVSVPNALTPLLARGLGVSKTQVSNALKGVAVANAAVVSIYASIDFLRVVNGKISGRQFLKNTAVTSAAVVAGSVGAVSGRAVGALFGSVGGPLGAFFGAALLGQLGASVTKRFVDKLIEDDRILIARLIRFQLLYLSKQYLLTADEIHVLANTVLRNLENLPPNDEAVTAINAVLLPHVVYLVKNRPSVSHLSFRNAARAYIDLAE